MATTSFHDISIFSIFLHTSFYRSVFKKQKALYFIDPNAKNAYMRFFDEKRFHANRWGKLCISTIWSFGKQFVDAKDHLQLYSNEMGFQLFLRRCASAILQRNGLPTIFKKMSEARCRVCKNRSISEMKLPKPFHALLSSIIGINQNSFHLRWNKLWLN